MKNNVFAIILLVVSAITATMVTMIFAASTAEAAATTMADSIPAEAAPAAIPSAFSATSNGTAEIARVDVDFDSTTGHCEVRIFTTGTKPDYSFPIPWGTAGSTIELRGATLSENYVQSNAAGPLMAYNLVQSQDNVLVRLSFLRNNVQARVAWSEKDNAIVITLDESGSEREQPMVDVPVSASQSTDSKIGTASQVSPSNKPTETRARAQPDFRNSLLAATRGLSNGRTPVTSPPVTYPAGGYQSGSTRISTVESTAKWKLDTIVLDAGHGGWDNGAISRGGLREKDLSLLIVRKLGARIEHELGIRVVYTRSGDDFIPLAERGKIANQSGGKLFVSVHANQANARNARGTETYFLGTHRSDSARVVMERENEIVRLEENAQEYGQLNAEELALRRISQSGNLQQSEKLASFVEDAFSDTAGRRSRGVKQAGFYVLFGASMPSILVELGFLSNSREASYLGSREGQTDLTESIFLAITRFRTEYEKGLSMTTVK